MTSQHKYNHDKTRLQEVKAIPDTTKYTYEQEEIPPISLTSLGTEIIRVKRFLIICIPIRELFYL
jgi:hypothetical protein